MNYIYHIEFSKSGLNSIIKLWLINGCKESPEEIDSIIKSEYAHREKLNLNFFTYKYCYS